MPLPTPASSTRASTSLSTTILALLGAETAGVRSLIKALNASHFIRAGLEGWVTCQNEDPLDIISKDSQKSEVGYMCPKYVLRVGLEAMLE